MTSLLIAMVAQVTEAEIDAFIEGVMEQEKACAEDGTLQGMIDLADEETEWYEARLQELREGMEDDAYHARGDW